MIGIVPLPSFRPDQRSKGEQPHRGGGGVLHAAGAGAEDRATGVLGAEDQQSGHGRSSQNGSYRRKKRRLLKWNCD